MTTPTQPSMDSKRLEEKHKVAIDFFKHLTTLSSGAILLTSTVYDKLKTLFSTSDGLVNCIKLFLIALICSLLGHAILVFRFGAIPTNSTRSGVAIALLVSGGCFLLAVGYFTWMVITADVPVAAVQRQ